MPRRLDPVDELKVALALFELLLPRVQRDEREEQALRNQCAVVRAIPGPLVTSFCQKCEISDCSMPPAVRMMIVCLNRFEVKANGRLMPTQLAPPDITARPPWGVANLVRVPRVQAHVPKVGRLLGDGRHGNGELLASEPT